MSAARPESQDHKVQYFSSKIPHDFCWYAVGHDVVGNMANNYGARANNRPSTDADVIGDCSADSNPSSLSDSALSANVNTGADMYTVFDDALVIHSGSGVHNDVRTDDAV